MNPANLTVPRFLAEAVERNGSDPFLVWTPDDAVITYEQFGREVERAAATWYELGVRKGDRVAFMVDNRPEFLSAWLGLARLGAILVAVNTGFGVREASYLVRDSGSRIALVDPGYVALFREAASEMPALERVLSVQPQEGMTSFAELSAEASTDVSDVDIDGDDVISLIYTSGTTGHPKGVMQTHRNFVMTGQAYPSWMGMERGDRIYACLPLFHINSQAYSTMGAIGADGTLVLAPRFSARRFWSDVRRHRVDVFNFIGAMTVILSKKAPEPEDADNDVKVAYGAPALPQDVVDEVERRFGLTVLSGFGMSETTFGLVEPVDGPRKPLSIGVPRNHPDPSVPRTEACIVDDEGRDVEDGTAGELLLRNAAMMKGYFNDPERTALAIDEDGWLHTGDSAWRDGDGYFYFVDRKKDIVRRRGENVSSLEVENLVNEHESVLESAVVGVPSELTDEDILLYVVPRQGRTIDPRELLAWCEQRMARFKVPRYVEFVDSLPKTPTSKIEKHRLRELVPSPLRYDGEAEASG